MSRPRPIEDVKLTEEDTRGDEDAIKGIVENVKRKLIYNSASSSDKSI